MKRLHLPMTRANPNHIQEKALKSIRSDFNKAATKATQNLLAHLKHEDEVRNTSLFYNYKLHELQFLLKGAKGEYASQEGYYHTPHTVWEDYLQELGRCYYGVGAAMLNDCTIRDLIKQNGPKKMEDRLRRFLKRRIDVALYNCSLPKGPYI